MLDFDPQPLLKTIKSPVLWIFGDPKLDRFSPVTLSISRLDILKKDGKSFEIIQIDKVGHTLEYPNNAILRTTLDIRIPLILRIFNWLDEKEIRR